MALSHLAHVLAERDLDHAQSLLDDAAEAAEQLEESDQSARVLASIAKAVNGIDHDQAVQVADRALEIALSDSDEFMEAEFVPELVDLFAEGGLWEQSITAHAAIELPDGQEVSHDHLVRALAKAHRWQAARKLAFGIDDLTARWRAVCVLTGAIAAAGQGKHGAELASQIQDPEWRAVALASVAQRMAAYDRDNAIELAASVYDTFTVTGRSIPPRVLVAYAIALGERDPDRALRLIDDAEKAVYRYKDPAIELAALAEALAGTARDSSARLATGACRVLESLDTVARAATTWNLFDKFVDAGLWDHAEQVARTVPYPHALARLLTDIAEAVATADPLRAIRLVEDAESTVRAHGYVSRPDVKWDQIFDTLIGLQCWDQARRLIAATSSDSGHRSRLNRLLTAIVAAGDREAAGTIVTGLDGSHLQEQLVQWLSLVTHSGTPNSGTPSARLRGEPSDRQNSEYLDNRAEPRAPDDAQVVLIEDLEERREAVHALIKRHARAARWSDAERLAHGLDTPEDRAFGLISIVSNSPLPLSSVITNLVDRVLHEVQMIADPGLGVDAACALCQALRNAYSVTLAERVARTVEPPGVRAGLLVQIASSVSAVNQRRAQELIGEAESLVASIDDWILNARNTAYLAKGLAEAGWPERAETLADRIEYFDERARALGYISEALSAADSFDEAERVALKIELPQQRSWILKHIIQQLTSNARQAMTHRSKRTQLHRLLAYSLTGSEPFDAISACANVFSAEIDRLNQGVAPRLLDSDINDDAIGQ
jgi:hypothetical protein